MHEASKSRNVKSMIFQAFTFKNVKGKYVELPVYEERIQYDPKGRILKHRELHWRLNPRKRPIASEYKHNYDGEEEIEVQYYFPVGELMRKEQNEFDAGGRLTCSRTFSPDGRCIYENYFSHDEKDNLVEMVDFNAELNLKSIYKYQYDGDGNMIRRVVYDATGELWGETQSIYDRQGNKINEITLGRDHVQREEIVCEYNRDGDIIRRKRYNKTLEDITEYSYVRSGKSLTKICRQYRFDCDCTGVRRIPKSTEVTKYLYF